MNELDLIAERQMRERAVARMLIPDPDPMFRARPILNSLEDTKEILEEGAARFTSFELFGEALGPHPFGSVGVLVNCTPAQNNRNKQCAAGLNRRSDLLEIIGQQCDQITNNSYSGKGVEAAITAYNNATFDGTYYVCDPTIQDVQNAYDRYVQVKAQCDQKAIAASDRLIGHARNQLQELERIGREVQQARTDFENTAMGGTGLRELNAAHSRFQAQERTTSTFQLGAWYPDHDTKATQFYQACVNAHNAEARASAVDELDRLRDEYVVKADRRVPARGEFTQSGGSANFSFGELNTGDYSWAILTAGFLAKLEATRANAGGHVLTIGSGYRNPVRNDALEPAVPNSWHQYGRAADVNPSDLNGDGTITSADRDILEKAARDAGFTEIIPKTYTVHMADE
jgi:hypothetical protein